MASADFLVMFLLKYPPKHNDPLCFAPLMDWSIGISNAATCLTSSSDNSFNLSSSSISLNPSFDFDSLYPKPWLTNVSLTVALTSSTVAISDSLLISLITPYVLVSPVPLSKMVDPGKTHCLVLSFVNISIACPRDFPANSVIS